MERLRKRRKQLDQSFEATREAAITTTQGAAALSGVPSRRFRREPDAWVPFIEALARRSAGILPL
jgi:hypothetical protein